MKNSKIKKKFQEFQEFQKSQKSQKFQKLQKFQKKLKTHPLAIYGSKKTYCPIATLYSLASKNTKDAKMS